MKTARMGMMVFTFLSLTGGYFLHQYFWLGSAEGAEKWSASVLPMTIGLGWVLLIGALVLGFSKESDG
jgi:hypothetical protein